LPVTQPNGKNRTSCYSTCGDKIEQLERELQTNFKRMAAMQVELR